MKNKIFGAAIDAWLRLLVTTCPELVSGRPNNGSAGEDQRGLKERQ